MNKTWPVIEAEILSITIDDAVAFKRHGSRSKASDKKTSGHKSQDHKRPSQKPPITETPQSKMPPIQKAPKNILSTAHTQTQQGCDKAYKT